MFAHRPCRGCGHGGEDRDTLNRPGNGEGGSGGPGEQSIEPDGMGAVGSAGNGMADGHLLIAAYTSKGDSSVDEGYFG